VLGPIIYAYCYWFHKVVSNRNRSEKIWFAARDMYLFEDAYRRLFPKEDESYIYISRKSLRPMYAQALESIARSGDVFARGKYSLRDVVQYLGNTTGNYTKDMWYRCVFNDPTYSWEKIDYGSSITVDSALSTSSTNPVQNKVITTNLATKQNSTLSTAIGGQTTVEDCLTALNNRVKATYDSNGSWVEVEVTLP
jgi:hypothetical protein